MISTYSTSVSNTLRALVPAHIKHFLVARLFFGQTTGRLIRLAAPKKNLKGLRFDVNSDNISLAEVADLYFNRRERAEFDLVRRHILQSDIVNIVELGVSIGFIASNIVFTKKVNYLGIEASQRLAREARANVESNNQSDSMWRIENFCIDYSGADYVEFAESTDSLAGRVGSGSGQGVLVPAARFGDLIRRCGMQNFALIADIEGSEADILFKDEESLRSCRLIVAELEDTAEFSTDDQVRRAQEIGFELRELYGHVFAFRRRA